MREKLYQKVYDALRQQIESGALPLGGKLPSQDDLIAEFDVSSITVRRALDMLRDDGFIVRRPKIGSVVVADRPVVQAARTDRALLGCVMTNFDDVFGTHLLAGILDAAEDHADVIAKRSFGSPETEERMLAELIEAGCQGIMLLPSSSHVVPSAILQLAAQNFPVVILDRIFESVPVSVVCSDNFEAARSATEYLFSLGHTQLGVVLPSSTVSTIDDRRNGFVIAHAAAHFPYEPAHEFNQMRSVVPGSDTPRADDLARLTDYLRAHPELTGFLTSEYKVARILVEAAADLGRDCPESISVVCFDHPPFDAEVGGFQFTHVKQDQSRMGHVAVSQVLQQIADPGAIAKHVLPTELVIGDSTAPV